VRPGPLDGLLVIDCSQFLSGPSAALRLADLGARVIKVERPDGGDICRRLYLSDTEIDGDSTLFHAINRNKEGLALDLKQAEGLADLRRLLARADVLILNFRPGVADKLGIGYEAVRAINPRIVYASITGYGEDSPWAALPGQDLLAQAVSGAAWLSGSEGDGPMPMGLPVADMLAGHILVEGILAALLRRSVSGEGSLVQTSLLEAMIDLQFEVLTTHLNDGGRAPMRGSFRGAHAYLAAPYGMYATSDGHLALAMTPLDELGMLLELPALRGLPAGDEFRRRDELKRHIADRLASAPTRHWLERLRAHDVWCAEVLDWPRLMASAAFERLQMLQSVERGAGAPLRTTSSPLRIEGTRPQSTAAAPRVGEHGARLANEFGLTTPLTGARS
jgi:crotonobetainyl-CoA:carnitine CoA-transferase CaiB-like acyl-CoA transferase